MKLEQAGYGKWVFCTITVAEHPPTQVYFLYPCVRLKLLAWVSRRKGFPMDCSLACVSADAKISAQQSVD